MKTKIIGLFISLIFITGMANAATIPFEFHGSADIVPGTPFTVSPDAVSGNDLIFENRNTGAFLGNGGFEAFNVSVGEELSFFLNDLSGLVELSATIDSFITLVSGDFSFVATSNTGEIVQLTISNSRNSESIDGWGSYERHNVPEPTVIELFSIVLFCLGLSKLISRKKTKQNLGTNTHGLALA